MGGDAWFRRSAPVRCSGTAVAVGAALVAARIASPEGLRRSIALLAGLNYVYTGNVRDPAGGSTYCPSCEKKVIGRDWYNISSYDLADDGACRFCGTHLAGRFQKFGKPFGPRRIPVRLQQEKALP